jgi:hypothetical protein
MLDWSMPVAAAMSFCAALLLTVMTYRHHDAFTRSG